METHVMAAAAAATTPPATFSNGPLDEGFQAGRKPRKEYKCHACDKVFKRSEHFTRHVRVHTKERPFSCRFCQKTYGRKDLVRRHEKTLHAELCERADEERARNGGGRQENARWENEQQQQLHYQQQSQTDFNHGASFGNAEQPYPMHHVPPQDGHLYSPVSHHSGNHDHGPEPLPHSEPTAPGEPLMIDPMLDEAFAGPGLHSNDQYGANASQHYQQSSPYFHQADANAATIPVDPSLDFGGDNPVPAENHHGPADQSSSLVNPAYGQYSSYQPQPYDYR